jgi:tetratricopeptide (TPR) repeat protein
VPRPKPLVRPNVPHRPRPVVHRTQRFITTINHFHRPWAHHHNWYHGGWRTWPRYPAVWSGLAEEPGPRENAFTYDNPYFATPSIALNPYATLPPPALDYSRALAVPTEEQADNTKEPVVKDALTAFDKSRAAFKKGDYADATTEVNRALDQLPGDRSMQEFRALTLFARGKYADAAGVIYAVLAAGPGWDWDTLAALYDNEQTYPRQLRALEEYVRDHPGEGRTHFLLAYHYLVLEEHDSAVAELRLAAKLAPRDKLSVQLADALSSKPRATERDRD